MRALGTSLETSPTLVIVITWVNSVPRRHYNVFEDSVGILKNVNALII